MNVLENSSRKLSAIAVIVIFLGVSVLFPLHFTSGASRSTGLIVPLYTYPSDSSWQQLIQEKQAYPNVPIAAVINPNSGPGSAQDPNFVQGINSLRAAGVIVLGYVATGYGSTSVSSVESQINDYHSWYNVNGILFDEMNNQPGYESYYSTLDTYAHSLGYTWTVANPGTSIPSSYIGTMDTFVIYENSGLPSISQVSSATGGYPISDFALVAYGVSGSSVTQSYISSAGNYISWIYVTDANLPNPYDILPSYLSSLMAYLSGSSPSSTTTSTSTSSTTTISTSSSTTTIDATVPITVESFIQNGTQIQGMYDILQSGNGTVLATGFTPSTYTTTTGDQYLVTVDNYGNFVFSNWSSGSTDPTLTITSSQSATLKAYYQDTQSTTTTTTQTSSSTTSPPTTTTTQTSSSTTSPPTTTTTQTSTSTTSPPTTTTTQTSTSTTTSSSTGSASSSQNGSVVLTILTRDTRGNVINGLYTVIQSSNGSTLATGYSPMVYNATSGEEYVISVENYHPYYFRHWDTGASTPSILIAPAQNTTLTAYYAVWNGWFNRITSEFAGLVQPSGMYTIVDLTMVVALFIISRYMFLRRH